MYKIVAYDSPTDTVGKAIYMPEIGRVIPAGNLTLSETDIDNADLTVNRNNPLYNNVKPFQTHINVYQDGNLIFRGRALKPTKAMDSTGIFTQEYTFESIISYLLDSIQDFNEFLNLTPQQLLTKIINDHNAQMPAYKQFKVGTVTVQDTSNALADVYLADYATTYDTIQSKLIDVLGGYLVLRIEPDGNYLDYLSSVGTVHTDDAIKIGKNLESSSVAVDPTTVITRLVPLGATQEPAETDDTSDDDTTVVDDTTTDNKSYPRLTISSVNDGKNYIDIPDLQAEFGIITGIQTYDDITDATTLKQTAESWIAQQNVATESWTIEAVELLDGSYERFNLHDSYPFVNPDISPTQPLRITQKEIDFTNPQKSTLTIGETQVKLTDYQAELNKKTQGDTFQPTFVKRITASLNSLIANKNDIKGNLALVPNQLLNSKNSPYNFAVLDGTRLGSNGQQIPVSELWILVNAYYDYDRQRFCRYNVNDFSFGWQLQGGGTYPGEESIGDTNNQGVNLWKANGKSAYGADDPSRDATGTDIGAWETNADGSKYWREYGIMLGWNNIFMNDSYGGMTIGGSGFEIDGSGVNPFRRVTSTKFSGGTSTGLADDKYMKMFEGDLWNAQHGMWNKDQDTQNGYFWGMESPVRYMENGSYNQYSDTAMLTTDTDSFVVMMNEANMPKTIENWKYMMKVTMKGRGYIADKPIITANQTIELTSSTATSSWSTAWPTGFTKDNCLIVGSLEYLADGSVKQATQNGYTFTDYGIDIWSQDACVKLKLILSFIDNDVNLGNTTKDSD